MTLLSIDDIHVHENVRVSEEGIEALARSMNAIGQISPVTVIRNEVGYHLVTGHRRLAAAKSLGWTEIEAFENPETDQLLAQQMAENMARLDLTAWETAQGVLALKDEAGMNQADISAALGISKDQVSVYQKIAKGAKGLDPVSLNQMELEELEVFEHFHDAPDEIRKDVVEAFESDEDSYWKVNSYIDEVKKWRWSQLKENKPLVEAMEAIGAIPMNREDRQMSKHLDGKEILEHRGQPCHGYMIQRSWNRDEAYSITEYCMDPQSHIEDEDKPELVKMSKDAATKQIGGTNQQRAAEKKRKDDKARRKELVVAFARDPKIKPLTEMLYTVILNIQAPYRWNELGKAYGLTKDKDTFHYDWNEQYLGAFAAKEKLVQQLILAVGSVYISMDSTYRATENEALITLDRLFGFTVPDEAGDGTD